MQDKASPHFDRSAIAHQKIARPFRHHDCLLLIENTQLNEDIRKFHVLDTVDDQAHSAFLRVRTNIDDRARKPAVVHSRHSEKELSIQKSGLFVGVSENLHENKGTKDSVNDNGFG